jgi:hypothetical protein
MSTDAQPVASSATPDAPPVATTAVEQAVASNDIPAFREARRAERSGKPVDAKPADSSPASETPDPASSADPEKKPRTDKRASENRIPELLAERAALKAELDALKRAATPPAVDAKPAASSPAPVETFPTYDAYLTEHPDASYEQYLDERSDFRVEQKLRAEREKVETTERAARQSASVTERDTKFRSRLDEATKADPAFLETLSADVLALKPFSAIRDAAGRWTEQPTGYHAVADEVLSSEVAPQLMRHFSDHPDDLHWIAKLLPHQLLKEIGKLEVSLGPRAKAPTPKLVTDAPPPATTLASGSGSTGNPVDAAVASGDMVAFKAARLRERMATLR